MNKRVLFKLITCTVVLVCCFMPLSFAEEAQFPGEIQLLREVTEIKDTLDKSLTEKSTALLVPTGKYLGDKFTFEGDGSADNPIVIVDKSGKRYENAYIKLKDSEGNMVCSIPVYGNVTNPEGGYALNMLTYCDKYDKDTTYNICIVDQAGNEHSAGTISLHEKKYTEGQRGILGTIVGLIVDRVNTVATMVEEIIVTLLTRNR